jgi:hypothetical protein
MRFGFLSLKAFGIVAAASLAAQAADVDVEQAARLIRFAEKGVQDSRGWAADMLDVLRAHRMEQSKENVCAIIAVIDQESSFRADPPVPDLGKISEKSLRDKFDKVPLGGAMAVRFLESTPSSDDSYMMRIRTAKTERDLDLVYRRFIDDASRRASLGALVNSGLFNSVIDSRNDIDTAGSMQVSVKFALDTANKKRWLPMQLDDVYAVRDDLYTRRGGMYYGVLQLLGYETGYDKKVYRFADFNAGRYASRNAAFQLVVGEMTDQIMELDGDLLLYDKGKPLATSSKTELAVRRAAALAGRDLSNEQIRKDLLREKRFDFSDTRTFKWLRTAYVEKFGREPPYAVIPEINLTGPKIKRMMTTKIFAETVNKRYAACIARK